MRRHVLAVSSLGIAVAGWVARKKGTMQKAGEKVDRATDQGEVIGKGPVEKVGQSIDEAVKDLQK